MDERDKELRRKRDLAEAIGARRQAADMLLQASQLISRAHRKLSYNKSDDIQLRLTMIKMELDEKIEILQDPESDPN
ncbi:hypothetical protein GZH47_33535 (plasmid) [Paenibacillus rhizovicinus]|uniref:Uncharacterized protein n=1 Tax=Paenibacillus rhizovicinus TaxID=2704463 RepID=A0A6C0PBA1_9BACL|nr:hypothetical protein [Paenibacillus rhizovicinus]QHW35817.1 hypothetical protein GZH47_33535 [Paenibacillus rhizovicinus]